MGIGMAELLIVLGFLSGGLGGMPMEPLEVPRDTVWQASAHVLPGAHVVIHGNLEHAWNQLEGLMDEVRELKVIQGSSIALQGLSRARMMLNQGVVAAEAAMGLDLRKDLGSVTLSLRSEAPDRLQFLVRARGNFGGAGFREKVKAAAKEVVTQGEVVIYQLSDEAPTPLVICFPDESTALLGSPDRVNDALTGDTCGGWDPGCALIAEATARRGARALLFGGATPARPGAFLYLAPPAWVVDDLFKEPTMRHVASALRDLKGMVHVSVFGRGTLTVQAGTAAMAARAEHLVRAVSRLTEATEPVMDAVYHLSLALGPLLPSEEVGEEVVRLFRNEAALREAADWIRRRLLQGSGAITLAPESLRVSLDLDSPMGLTSLVMPLAGSFAYLWF